MTARKSDKSDTKEKALTAKQSRFVELVVMGASPSDAYRGAFDTQGKPETVLNSPEFHQAFHLKGGSL